MPRVVDVVWNRRAYQGARAGGPDAKRQPTVESRRLGAVGRMKNVPERRRRDTKPFGFWRGTRIQCRAYGAQFHAALTHSYEPGGSPQWADV